MLDITRFTVNAQAIWFSWRLQPLAAFCCYAHRLRMAGLRRSWFAAAGTPTPNRGSRRNASIRNGFESNRGISVGLAD